MRVMKFGGASVATPDHFLKIADLIIEKAEIDPEIVVVVSAMARTTDGLFDLAHQVHPFPPRRELDMLISVGERVSISLLAMALSLKGKEAISFTGSQSGIITCENHSDARIIDVRPHRLLPILEKKKIAIVAGFQGVSRKGEITTLGRGGSDTTAVALAAALKAPMVEFYKDVPGIFTEDPKVDPTAQHLVEMGYDEALLFAERGAKILHARSIALAKKNGIQISVRSFEAPECSGTFVRGRAKQSDVTSYEEVENVCSTAGI